MKIKQKIAIIAPLVLVAGFASVFFASILKSDSALAYTMEENCSEYESPVERGDCRSFQEANAEEKCTGEDCCGDVKTSIIKGDLCGTDEGSAETSTVFALLKGLLKIMTAGVGIAAVGGIGYGALLYTTAENKPEQTKKAIGIITNVVIGLVSYALMGVLLNFIIPGGVFG